MAGLRDPLKEPLRLEHGCTRKQARGVVTGMSGNGPDTLAECSVWLKHELRGKLLVGEATVALMRNTGAAHGL